MSHKKFGADRFSRFDVYWIQTNKQTTRQTDRQTDKPNLYIDSLVQRAHLFLSSFQKIFIHLMNVSKQSFLLTIIKA